MIVTTAEDSFNLFRPNLEPDMEEPTQQVKSDSDEETKQDSKDSKESSSISSQKKPISSNDVWVDSDDEEEEEQRIVRAAKQLNKQRRAKSKAKQ